MRLTSRICLLILALTALLPAQQAKWTKWDTTTEAIQWGTASLDVATTCHYIGRGVVNGRQFVESGPFKSCGGTAAFNFGLRGVGTAIHWGLVRSGHPKLGRAVNLIFSGGSLAGFTHNSIQRPRGF